MNFLVVAHDSADGDTLAKRASLRDEHQKGVISYVQSNKLLDGGVIIVTGNPVGSALLFDVPDRKTLDAIIAADPYMKAGVWDRIEIYELARPDPAAMRSLKD
ncbi:YciI family protein [Rhizobium sp. S163]|uniref:YciI family protein n=1 Tax=Rhizobium sp. S163 TaxID=3055039 RepID=UPI000DD55AA9|nr:YciI family protein [Rhizobium sp. S163]MDM9648344.1 YciI family protein [Rhizobium sp. S163]